MLVGNKSDCADTNRRVSLNHGELLANEWGCRFTECSAKEDPDRCQQVFHDMVDSIRKSKQFALSIRKPRAKACCHVM